MPIPSDHLTFYAALQRMVRSGLYVKEIQAAYRRAVEAARSRAPRDLRVRGGLAVDLSALPAARRQEEAFVAALQAGDEAAAQRAVFGSPLDESALRDLRAGRFDAVLERLDEEQVFVRELASVADPIRAVATRSASLAVEELPRELRQISRTAVELRARFIAQRQAGELVTNVTRESRAAISELAQQALQEGRDVYQTARTLKRVVGLNARQASGFEKFITKAIEDDRYKSAAGVQQAIDREYARLVGRRADVMARTELWQAGQDGQKEAWREAADEGMPIEGLDSVFVSRTGEKLDGPLAHPRCDCSARLRAVVLKDGRRVYVREWVVSVRNPCPRCLAFKGARAMPQG